MLDDAALRLVTLHAGRELALADFASVHAADELRRAGQGLLRNRPLAVRAAASDLPQLLEQRRKRRRRLEAWVRELGGVRRVSVEPGYEHKTGFCRACRIMHAPKSCIIPPKRFRRQVPRAVRVFVYDRDQHRCMYCGKQPTAPNRMTIDHVIPWIIKPSGDPWDLVAACLVCNKAKGDSLDWVPVGTCPRSRRVRETC